MAEMLAREDRASLSWKVRLHADPYEVALS